MIRWIGNGNERVRLAWLLAPPDGIFRKGEVASTVIEDVLPCLGLGKGKLVGSDADDVAVAVVDVLDVVDEVATVEGADES